MDTSFLIFGLLPLLAFVVIDAFLGLKSGLIAAIIFAVLECAYTIYSFGDLDLLSIVSLSFVLIFAFISLKTNKAIYIKMQPVFLGIIFGVVIFIFQFLDRPILLEMADKYQNLFPKDLGISLNNKSFREVLSKTSLNLGFGFFAHSILVGFAAMRLSNWWWLAIRGLGFYLMMAICVIAASF